MRVLIIDDNPLVREPLKSFLAAQPYRPTALEETGADGALLRVDSFHPDVILMELGLLTGDGLSLIRTIRTHRPKLPILVISFHNENVFAERTLRAGASGYLMKRAQASTLMEALIVVCQGDIYLNTPARQCILHKIKGDPPTSGPEATEVLSDRELEVFHLIGEGYSTHDVAEMLTLSGKTVETHRSHIKRKLALANNTGLTEIAAQWVLKTMLV